MTAPAADALAPGLLDSLGRELADLSADAAAALSADDLRACRKAFNALRHARGRRDPVPEAPEPPDDPPPDDGPLLRLRFGKRGYRAYRSALLARGPRCAFCGRKLTEETATLDHLLPKSQGGDNEPRNLALACESCNQSKGPRTPSEWAYAILRAAGVPDPAGEIARRAADEPEADPTPFLIPFRLPTEARR